MDVSTQVDGRTAIVRPVGRIDGTTTARLEQAITTLVSAGNARLVLDLQQVDYISSAGLRTILMAAKRAKTAAGGLVMFGLQPSVEEVMTTSGFATIVAIVDSEADARRELGD